jgi:hypothetical protein
MARNKKDGDDFDLFEGLAQRAAPSRPRASSGTRLSAPEPSLTLPGGARRTLAGMGPDDDDEVTREFPDDEVTRELPDDEDKTRELPTPRELARRADRAPARPPAAAIPAEPSRPSATRQPLASPVSSPPRTSRPPVSAPPPPSRERPSRPSPVSNPDLFDAPRRATNTSPSMRVAPPPRAVGSMPPWSSPPPPTAQMRSASMRPASVPDYAAPVIRTRDAASLRPRLGLSHAVAALAGGALLVLLTAIKAGDGRILVNASDSHGGPVDRLSVFVDGEKTACATAPCYLTYGTGTHEVKVIAEGLEVPATQAVAVKSGEAVAVHFRLLASSGGSGIKVGGAQAGVKLFIDQKEIGPLPQVVRDLSPGDHIIRVAGSDRYAAFERHVTLERDRTEDLGAITLKVLKGNVTVRPGTTGARVVISNGSDRRELLMLPISLDIDTTKSWALEATKAGYDDYRQRIDFDDGVADKTYTVSLEPRSATAQVPAEPANGAATPYSPPAYPAPVPAAPRSAPAGTGAAEVAEDGYLNINSIPPSICILDGKTLGMTPRLHISVKPGAHTVKFRDDDDGLTKTIFVTVGAGETKLAVARLNQP